MVASLTDYMILGLLYLKAIVVVCFSSGASGIRSNGVSMLDRPVWVSGPNILLLRIDLKQA